MDKYLDFSGPVKLIIVEQALLDKKGNRNGNSYKKILTKAVFNKKRNLISELRDDRIIEYQYDDNENRTLIRHKNRKGEQIEEIRQVFKGNQLVERLFLDSTGKLRRKRFYRYNDQNQLISETSEGNHIRYEYKNGFITKAFSYYGKEPDFVTLYNRDKNGFVINSEKRDKNGKLLRREEFIRTENFLTGLIITGNNGQIIKDERFEYNCYHEGNWLEMTRLCSVTKGIYHPVEIIYRSIAYSDTCPEVKPLNKQNSETEFLSESTGSIQFRDGSLYRGEILEGKMEGKGFIKWPDGTSYKGEFHLNRMEGQGILTWPNGDIYSGSFIQGKMEGIGRLRWANGKVFYGLFEGNRRTRQGIIEEEEE